MKSKNSKYSKIILIAAVALLIVGLVSMAFFFTKDSGIKTTLRGQFVSFSSCMGVVQGTLIKDYGNSTETACQNAEKYDEKIVEVIGYVYQSDCKKGEECFGGPYMKNIESIEIIG